MQIIALGMPERKDWIVSTRMPTRCLEHATKTTVASLMIEVEDAAGSGQST
jgi:hypothetical protein